MKRIIEQLKSIIGFAATIFLWAGSLFYLYQVLFKYPRARARTMDMFIFLSIISLILFIVIFCWRKYNYYRYGRRDRRKYVRPVTDEEIGGLFALSVGDVERLRSSPVLNLAVEKEYDQDGNVKKKTVSITGDGFTCKIHPGFPAEQAVSAGTAPRRLE